MPKRSIARRTATRKRFSLEEARAQVAGDTSCVATLLGPMLVMRCPGGTCPRCEALSTVWEAEKPEPPAPSVEVLAQLVARADVRARNWPSVRDALHAALAADPELADPAVRRDLAARLRALPAALIDTYPDL